MHLSFSRYRDLLVRYVWPQGWRVALLALLLLGGIALQLLSPQLLRFFIDAAQQATNQRVLLLAALLFIVVSLAQRSIALGTIYLGQRVSWEATNALRADLALHCLQLDLGFHKHHTPGELIERIDGDVTSLGNFFSQFTIQLLGNLVLIIAILALLFAEDWRIGLGLSLYTVVAFALLRALQHLGVQRWEAARQADAEQFGFLEERMSGTEDIRAAGAEAYTLRRLVAITETVLARYRAAKLVSNITFASTNFLLLLGYAIGLAVGIWLYREGNASIGTAFLIVSYVGMLAAPLENIREQVQDLQQATASIRRVDALLAIQPRVIEQATAQLPAGALGVRFSQVRFAYDDRDALADGSTAEDDAPPAVLRDCSFRLEAGQVLGVLGRTGSGKTTLTRLIARLYDPQQGTITLGDVNLRDLSFAELRARVGMVTQDVQIFQASIRENLALFDPQIDDARIERALAELGLLEWLRELPDGLDTRLGAGGLGLSAGEAQLLAFARVFLRDPSLVMLDEASSRLDPVTERRLERAIDRLLKGRTAIIIAHRLETIRRADAMLIIDDGRILEQGSYRDLAADPASRLSYLLRTGIEEVLA